MPASQLSSSLRLHLRQLRDRLEGADFAEALVKQASDRSDLYCREFLLEDKLECRDLKPRSQGGGHEKGRKGEGQFQQRPLGGINGPYFETGPGSLAKGGWGSGDASTVPWAIFHLEVTLSSGPAHRGACPGSPSH